jgi:hypothetical protein
MSQPMMMRGRVKVSSKRGGALKTDTLESLHNIKTLDIKNKGEDLKIPVKPLLVVSFLTLTFLGYHIYLTRFSISTDIASTPASSEVDSNFQGSKNRMAASIGPNTVSSLGARPEKEQGPFDSDAKAVILGCTKGVRALSGVKDPKSFMNLREYLEKAIQSPGHPPVETRLQSRRLRLIDQNGRRLRLHIAPKPEGVETSDKSSFDVKLFGFNDDNLPVRMPLTEEMAFGSIFETIDRFKARGQVDLDEVSEVMQWDAQTSAHIIRQNAKVLNLHINFAQGELNCRTPDGDQELVSCNCL